MNPQHRRNLGLCLLVSWMTLALISGCIHINVGPQAKAQRQDQLSSTINPAATLRIRTDFGSITVTGTDADECRVTAEVTANAPTQEEAQEILDQVKVILEPTDEGLSLHVEKPALRGNRSVGASFTVLVPRATALDGHTSFGSIGIEDITAPIKAHTSFASITTNRIRGPVRLTTSHGQIRCQQITSDNVVVESSFGNIELAFVPSDVNTGGPAGASIEAKTSHGSITCHQVSAGRVLTRTSFGNIHIDCLESAPATLQLDASTSHGSITCQAPSGFAGQVKLDTSFGEVRTERPLLVRGKLDKDHLTGTIGQGPGSLSLKTNFGSITLR